MQSDPSREHSTTKTLHLWPFRQLMTYQDAFVFIVTIGAAAVGFVASIIEQSWAFAAISFVLGTLTFQEYWTRVERFSKIEMEIENLPNELEQVLTEEIKSVLKRIGTVEILPNQEVTYGRLAESVRTAQIRFDIISGEKLLHDAPAIKAGYRRAQEQALERDLTYRIIMVDSTVESLTWVKERMEAWKDFKFYVGWLEEIPSDIVKCVLIDENEVHFGQGFLGDPDANTSNVIIQSPQVGRVFSEYFERLWNAEATIKLKDRKGIHTERIAEIEQRLVTQARVKKFPSVVAYLDRDGSYKHMLGALESAEHSIDIVSFVNLHSADLKRSKYYAALREAIERKHLSHQRIIWNKDHVLWLEQMLDDGWDNFPEFTVKFLQISKLSGTPLSTFDLIDQHIVIFGQGWITEGHVAIENPDVGHYFRSYFASLWNNAEWIKFRGEPGNRARLRELAKELPDVKP